MTFRKLLDGVTLRFCGWALIREVGPRYHWMPRYDPDGKIYMWLREDKPGDYAALNKALSTCPTRSK